MKVRTLIVDDEPLARDRIRTLLKARHEIEIVGEAANGREALQVIRSTQPDLLFLDIQMPEMDGFALLNALKEERLPLVIFVTAYDQFALQAFEFHAVDYLLKPFDRERFERALERATDQIKTARPEELTARLSALLADLQSSSSPSQRIAIKTSGKVRLLSPSEIDWIEAADNYVVIHTGNKTHIHRETLGSVQTRLGPRFVRVSRSAVVNIDKIKELEPMFHGDYSLLLETGARVVLSRNYRDSVKSLLPSE